MEIVLEVPYLWSPVSRTSHSTQIVPGITFKYTYNAIHANSQSLFISAPTKH